MNRIHPLASTTPRTRTEIRCSTDATSKLAELYNISKATVRKWKGRDGALDRSHRAHDLGTTLSPAQELIWMDEFLWERVRLVQSIALSYFRMHRWIFCIRH
jgi:hypothetical protein